jgi:hypothetical protein
MPRFETLPAVSYVGGRYPWRLDADLIYHSDIIGRVVVPAGYRTDFASVPRLPVVYWWTGGRAVLPSIIHDHCYDCRTDEMSRRTADRVFLEAMKAKRDPKRAVTRWAMYQGVRLGGWRAWRRDSSDKCAG